MCVPGIDFGHDSTWSLHLPTGLSGAKGTVLRGMTRGSGGFPVQLAPTWKRNGRGMVEVDKFAWHRGLEGYEVGLDLSRFTKPENGGCPFMPGGHADQ